MAAPNQTSKRDIVIVGGGLSGMCAAIAAAENGASVTVLDRAYGGGASAISGGVIYAGGGTKHQKEAGYDDTPENMLRYLQCEVGDAVDERTLRRFCEQSVLNLEWLESYGARFSGSMAPYKTSYPTGNYFLHYSGNEKAYPSVTLAKPAPRGHRPVGHGLAGMEMTGAALWGAIFDSAMRLGVSFQSASRAQKLLVNSEGGIIGVRYRAIDETVTWAAIPYRWLTQIAKRYQTTLQPLSLLLDYVADTIWDYGAREKTLESRAVILAAGGFVLNRDMTDRFIPWAKRTAPLGTAGDDGSGIKLGQSVGGRVSHMDRMSTWRFIYPPEALVEGIIVSPRGERIAAEDTYGASFTDAMIERSNGRGFLILDSFQWNRFASQIEDQTQGLWRVLVNYIKLWGHQSAASLDDLAKVLQVNPRRMKSTVEAHNNSIREGLPDPVGKLEFRSVIATGPFYGINISIRSSGIMMVPALTLGGLDVDGATGMVLDGGGNKIAGLYAAGRNAVGLCSHRYISGLSLADCVFSGKRAGEHAAQN